MTPGRRALLLCVTLLCGLQGLAADPRGFCARNHCSAAFQTPADFAAARKGCEHAGGQLLPAPAEPRELRPLLGGLRGVFWLAQGARDAAAGLRNCSAVSAEHDGVVVSLPCGEQVSGFLCRFTFREPCGPLRTPQGAPVTYTTHSGFQVLFQVSFSETFPLQSAMFPQGTVAVEQRIGEEHPDSKHLCFSASWLRAPWNCEVMRGGCEHTCASASCLCPAGQIVHPNNSFTCAAAACAEGDACACSRGYKAAPDGKGCVDVDECAEEGPCTGDGEECVNTEGAFECRCAAGFVEEDGACADVSICQKCEHGVCEKGDGAYRCACRGGFRVAEREPTRCEQVCDAKECPAVCTENPDQTQEDLRFTCYCPDGYIVDHRNGTNVCTDIDECDNERQCEHTCENLLGGYRCSCRDGYVLFDEYMCVRPGDEEEEEEEGEEGGAGPPVAASPRPAVLPPYVKTGSILGISLFMALAAALLFALVRHMARRCGRFELTSIKRPDMDIFYLQQVTTETYKKLHLDK